MIPPFENARRRFGEIRYSQWAMAHRMIREIAAQRYVPARATIIKNRCASLWSPPSGVIASMADRGCSVTIG
jgi:hypothetical protein